jgi:hypothetical protein
MYIIKENDRVFYGPKIWDKQELQSSIFERLNINFPLQWANPNEKVIKVNDVVSIMPVIFRSDPTHNKRSQKLDGPFYDYTDTHAEQYYTIIDATLEQAKNVCLSAVEQARREMVDNGVVVTILGNEYLIKTKIYNRNNYSFGIPGNWKMERIDLTDGSNALNVYQTETVWVSLTQENLDHITSEIKSFIQQQFDTEKTMKDNITALTTMEEIISFEFPAGVSV